MALLESSLPYQDSVVRLRATAADGVKLRAQLSTSSPPLRLEIEDGSDGGKKEAIPLMAEFLGGHEKEDPMISRAVPFLLQPGGVASLRLDNLLSKLIGTDNSASDFSSNTEAMDALSLSGSPPQHIFSVSVHFASSRAIRMYPISSITIRAEGIDFPLLLCLQSEFFCALLYGPFAESGKDLVELETFTAEEIFILYRAIQGGLPLSTENAMTALAVADRVLSPSLKAQIAAVSIPNDQEEKEEWLLSADTYGNMEIANRIVFSIPPREASAVHLRLIGKISNDDVHRFLVLRASGKLLPWLRMDTFITVEMERFGKVRIRLFTEEMLDVAEELLEMLPRTVTWHKSHWNDVWIGDYSFYAPDFFLTTPCTMKRSHEGWALCTKRSGIYLKRSHIDNDQGFIPIGEVVSGVSVLKDLYNKNTKSFVRSD